MRLDLLEANRNAFTSAGLHESKDAFHDFQVRHNFLLRVEPALFRPALGPGRGATNRIRGVGLDDEWGVGEFNENVENGKQFADVVRPVFDTGVGEAAVFGKPRPSGRAVHAFGGVEVA